jgi:hypothetical protein
MGVEDPPARDLSPGAAPKGVEAPLTAVPLSTLLRTTLSAQHPDRPSIGEDGPHRRGTSPRPRVSLGRTDANGIGANALLGDLLR